MRRGLVLVMLCGCSFAFVRGPKPAPAAPDCTQSRLVPILDTVFTAAMAITAIYTATSDAATWRGEFCDQFDASCNAPVSQGVGATIYSIAALAGGAGMWWGYTRVDQCRQAQPTMEAQPQPAPIVVTPPLPPPVDAGVDADTSPPIPPTGLPVPGAT
jgi:hypothetical protein